MTDLQNDNREQGKFFEERFFRQAGLNGLQAIKNPLSCKWAWTKLHLVKGQLDYLLLKKKITAFIDCKSFVGEYFTFSGLDPHQVERAILFNEWEIPAGFVVWLRGDNTVTFFTGQKIAEFGERSRFTSADGVLLGSIEDFDLRRVFDVSSVPLANP